ncbi:hypothetical protein SOVF_191060, partial [Spinacia oleracea]
PARDGSLDSSLPRCFALLCASLGQRGMAREIPRCLALLLFCVSPGQRGMAREIPRCHASPAFAPCAFPRQFGRARVSLPRHLPSTNH